MSEIIPHTGPELAEKMLDEMYDNAGRLPAPSLESELTDLREKIVASGVPLLSMDEIDNVIARQRGANGGLAPILPWFATLVAKHREENDQRDLICYAAACHENYAQALSKANLPVPLQMLDALFELLKEEARKEGFDLESEFDLWVDEA